MSETNLSELYEATLQLSNLTALQQNVLRAALKLFAQQGFSATSTAQIAKEANVSSGSVFKQFPTKEALLNAVLAPFFQGILDTSVDDFVANGMTENPVKLDDFITLFVKDRFYFIRDNLEIMELITEQMLTNPEFLAKLQAFLRPQFEKHVIPQLDELMKNGELKKLPYDTILQLILGTIHGYFAKLHMKMNVRSIDEEIKLTSQMLISALKK